MSFSKSAALFLALVALGSALGCGKETRGFDPNTGPSGDSRRVGAQNKQSAEARKVLSGPWCSVVEGRSLLRRMVFLPNGALWVDFYTIHESRRGDRVERVGGTWGLEDQKLMLRYGGETQIHFIAKSRRPHVLLLKQTPEASERASSFMLHCD